LGTPNKDRDKSKPGFVTEAERSLAVVTEQLQQQQ